MSATTDEHEPKKTEEENKEEKYDDKDTEEEDGKEGAVGKEDSADPQEAHTDRKNYAGHKEADVVSKDYSDPQEDHTDRKNYVDQEETRAHGEAINANQKEIDTKEDEEHSLYKFFQELHQAQNDINKLREIRSLMEYNKTSAEQGLKNLRKEAKPKEEDKTYLNAEFDKYKRRLALVESAIKKIQHKEKCDT